MSLRKDDFQLIAIFLILIAVGFAIIIFTTPDDNILNKNIENQSLNHDIDKAAQYHKKVAMVLNRIDSQWHEYEKESKKHLNNANLYGLYDDASALKSASCIDYKHLSAPTLENEKANNDIHSLENAVKNYAFSMREFSSKIMDFSNEGAISPKSLHEIKDLAQYSNLQAIKITGYIISLYADLGIDNIDKIDLENGGLIDPPLQSTPKNHTQDSDESAPHQ